MGTRRSAAPSALAILALATIVVLAAACRDDAPSGVSAARPSPARVGSLSAALSESATRAAVPRELLVAIARVEDGLTIPRTRTALRLDEDVPAAGPLQLRRGKLDTLRRGAELVGATEIELRSDADLALEAGAKVLAELGGATGATTGDLASWNAALEEMSGFADDAHRRHYAHQVFAVLARGGAFAGRDGEVVELAPQALPPSLTVDLSDTLHPLAATPEYPGAEWIPTSCKNKCDVTRNGNSVQYIVIHDTEGSWNASVATLQNDPEKSVHYMVNTDGHVAQFVTEATGAWHAGNRTYNYRSIGIEHVGYAVQPFPEEQYAASASLVDHLASKYAVPRDRAHVIGHDQVPDNTRIAADSPPCSDSPAACEASDDWGGANNHRDPGIWEWATYMPRFGGQAKCNDVTELWRCTADNKKRLQCAGAGAGQGTISIESCPGSCAAGPSATTNGNEAVCTTAPASTTPPTTSSTPTPSTAERPPAEETPPAPEDSGCRIAEGTAPTGPGSASFLLFVVSAALSATRARGELRRERRKDGRKRALDGSRRVVRFL